MRILSQRIYKGVGFLRVLPVDEDDFWHLYNLITIGDLVKTSTYRKIVKEGIKSIYSFRINWIQDIREKKNYPVIKSL